MALPHALTRILYPLICCGMLTGCLITEESGPAETGEAIVRPAQVTRSWIVRSEGRTLGSVIRLQESSESGVFLYTVRNLHNQDLGLIDDQGRAWRYRPHRSPDWLATGTVEAGVRAILEIQGPARLDEVPPHELTGRIEAAVRR